MQLFFSDLRQLDEPDREHRAASGRLGVHEHQDLQDHEGPILVPHQEGSGKICCHIVSYTTLYYFGPFNALGGLVKARFCHLTCYRCAEIDHLGLNQLITGRISPGRRLFKILYKKIFGHKTTYAC